MRLMVFAVLIGALMLQVFSKTIIYAGFLANQEYIAKNLCENRDAPEKNCCGKCQLEKRMANDDAQQDSPLPGLFKSLKEVKWMNEETVSFFFKSTFDNEILFPSYRDLSSPGFHGDVFRPPCVSLL